MLIGLFVLNFIISGALSYVFQLIAALQIVLHLPLFGVKIPAIVSSVFEILMPIAKYDIAYLLKDMAFY